MRYFEKVIAVKTIGASNYKVRLTAYIPDQILENENQQARPAVLILPGGGYERTSKREAEPVAMRFVSEGLCAFVLDYSIAPARFPQALCEALSAASYIRENAKDWQIDPHKIAVRGFSAGGHLAASVGIFWNQEWLKSYLKIEADQ